MKALQDDNPLSHVVTAPPDQVEPCGHELLNCPFCGSEPEIIEEQQVRKYTQNIKMIPEHARFQGHTIEERTRWDSRRARHITYTCEVWVYTVDLVTVTCSNPSCMARNTNKKVADMERAVARWNQRA